MDELDRTTWVLQNEIVSRTRLSRLLGTVLSVGESKVAAFLDAILESRRGQLCAFPDYDDNGYPFEYSEDQHDPSKLLRCFERQSDSHIRYCEGYVEHTDSMFDEVTQTEQPPTTRTAPDRENDPVSEFNSIVEFGYTGSSGLADRFLRLDDLLDVLKTDKTISFPSWINGDKGAGTLVNAINDIEASAFGEFPADQDIEDAELSPYDLQEIIDTVKDNIHSERLKVALDAYMKYWHPVASGKTDSSDIMDDRKNKDRWYECLLDDKTLHFDSVSAAKSTYYVITPNRYLGKGRK